LSESVVAAGSGDTGIARSFVIIPMTFCLGGVLFGYWDRDTICFWLFLVFGV